MCRNIGILSKIKYFLSSSHLLLLYNSLFLSHVNYCCFIYCNTFSSHIHEIEKLQKRAVRIVEGKPRLSHTSPIFKKLKLLKLTDIGQQQILLIMHRKIRGELPAALSNLFVPFTLSRPSRNAKHFEETFTPKIHVVSSAVPVSRAASIQVTSSLYRWPPLQGPPPWAEGTSLHGASSTKGRLSVSMTSLHETSTKGIVEVSLCTGQLCLGPLLKGPPLCEAILLYKTSPIWEKGFSAWAFSTRDFLSVQKTFLSVIPLRGLPSEPRASPLHGATRLFGATRSEHTAYAVFAV